MYTYTIKNNEGAISKSISQMVNNEIEIILIKDIDNRRIILFKMDSQIGEARLTKGSNNQFKLDSTGHGTNEVRYRIWSTDKGQYVVFMGRNNENISEILTFVDGEKYKLIVPDNEEYFIAYSPLQRKTESSFPSGSVWYDKEGNEIIRIGISKDYIL